MGRNYRKEYDNYHARPEQIANRAERGKARAEMKKKLGAAAIAGKDIDHKKPIRSGGGNGGGNLRVAPVGSNRSRNGHQPGEKQKH
jgi:hypothetical protein